MQLWVERITQTWVHCSKFTGRSIRARNLADSFAHTQQHLLQENAALCQSVEELTKQQTGRQLDVSERWAFYIQQVYQSDTHFASQQTETPVGADDWYQ